MSSIQNTSRCHNGGTRSLEREKNIFSLFLSRIDDTVHTMFHLTSFHFAKFGELCNRQ